LKFQELDIVEVAEPIEEADDSYRNEKVSLPKGASGTVVSAFSNPSEAYDVEFLKAGGNDSAILTLLPHQLIAARSQEER
jgi:hypothetical protein